MQTKTEPEMRLLATSMLVPNPQQPRKIFDRDALLGLGSSMKESGQIHPLIVDDAGNGTYIVVDGERRWRAAELVGIPELMAIIRQLGEQNADTRHLIEALVTSTQREELSPVEFARACGKLKGMGLSNRSIADKIGTYTERVRIALRLLELDEELLVLVDAGKLPKDPRVVDALLSIENRETRVKLGEKMARSGIGIDAIVNACRRLNESLQNQAQAQTEDVPALVLAKRAVHRTDNKATAKWEVVRAAAKGMCDACVANPRTPAAPEPAWWLITQSASSTCKECSMRKSAVNKDLSICKECPAVALLQRLAVAA